ncbi:putative ABC transport system permease protein [Ruminococcus sp. YE71]|uniref:ABC transporter permease n=1 Tax=unclassified Ruminococcus TaxID=2608920 RepID=UPI00088C0662|nr:MULTISPECIES: ABC transporter permease [unclassified Ruminococcus]SDA16756.1 putative ABC transport system permease protein [Ruminococcus sp. YE78]SFW25579.1 putative ABC transport system permease protein [Ruminococcus sp. YE71]
MFTLLMRKMRNTKWMVFCLLIGFIMAAAMTSTIPIYMNASLQRMLVKDMENFQTSEGVYPGTYATTHSVTLDTDTATQKAEIKKIQGIVKDGYDSLDCPASFEKTYIADEFLYVTSIAITDGSSAARLTLGGMTGLEDAVEVVRGRMYQKGQRSDGVYECVTTERALKVSELATDTVYEIGNIFGADKTVKIEIVGVIDVKDGYEAYWAEGLGEYLNTMFADYDTLFGEIMDTGAVNITSMAVRYAIDYPKMNMNILGLVNDRIEQQRRTYEDNDISFKIPAADIFVDYADRASQLRETLWLLQIPVILMILVYLFMVSQLNVEQEKNEIAVFKSRGASRGQIIRIYALESMFLGVMTAVVAPFVGMGLCRMLGASNGFLEFVNRKSLPITLAKDAFIYAGAAVIVFFLTTMAPIIPSTKTTIVEHKQSKAKKRKLPLWEKLCVDFVLIGGSLTWLYYYTKKQADLTADGITDREAAINPMMFIASAAFIVGCGLFIIRIHPLIIRIFSKLLGRVLSPAAYVSFNNIGRSAAGKERFLMIFLILTVSLGLYFANTARALNRNAEERVTYDVGADVVMKEEWSNTSGELRAASAKESGDAAKNAGSNGQQISSEEQEIEVDEDEVEYSEPPIERFEQLAGVKSVARVYIRNSINVKSSRMKVPKVSKVKDEAQRKELAAANADSSRTADNTDNVNLMAISPGEFSKVCNFYDRLLPYHINEYLNALSDYPQGILLSNAFMETYGLKTGDTVTVSWGGNDAFEATVLAFVDFWPSMNPYLTAKDGSYMNFAIMNLDYVKIMSKIEPYQVWIRLEDGALTEDLYKSIEKSDIEPTLLRVAGQEIITQKNDPMLQGMNGALTLGFIVIMIMCIIGFLMYWILSIKSRTLQFGILRAMGMKYHEIIAMILYEQLLTSGAAILSAIFIGGIASELYVPLFQYLFTTAEQVPGFVVIPQRADYLKVYTIILAMLLICFLVLGSLIRKINISKALKLGED